MSGPGGRFRGTPRPRAGAGLGLQVRRGPGNTQPGPPPRGALHSGREGGGGPGPLLSAGGAGRAVRGFARLALDPVAPFGRRTPVGSAAGNFSLPDPSAFTEFELRVCLIVLVLGNGETSARPRLSAGGHRERGWDPGSLGPTWKAPGPRGWRRASQVARSLRAAAAARYLAGLVPAPAIWAHSAGPLCLLIPGRRKPAGGASVSGSFSASGGLGHLKGRYGDPVCFPRQRGWSCAVIR